MGTLCSSMGETDLCISSTALCEVFFTRLDQKTRMSSNAGCYITQLDSSHSLIHSSAYLYPFKSKDLATPPPSQAASKQGLMNNRRKDAARLLRENKCVRTTSVNGILINQVPADIRKKRGTNNGKTVVIEFKGTLHLQNGRLSVDDSPCVTLRKT